jgi:hypothetical protein
VVRRTAVREEVAVFEADVKTRASALPRRRRWRTRRSKSNEPQILYSRAV